MGNIGLKAICEIVTTCPKLVALDLGNYYATKDMD